MAVRFFSAQVRSWIVLYTQFVKQQIIDNDDIENTNVDRKISDELCNKEKYQLTSVLRF